MPKVPKGMIDPAASALITTMLQGEKSLVVSGMQTTVLYRAGRMVTSTQTVLRNGDRAYRMEYMSPAGLAGRVVVDNGQMEWDYLPRKSVMQVSPSRLGSLRQRIGPALRALRRGEFNAAVVGQDQVAGHAAQIVQVSSTGPFAGMRRFWIDPTNGAQLKIEVYGADGRLNSTTYYTEVAYNPPLDKHAFAPPKVPKNTQVSSGAIGLTLSAIPTDAQAGFHILQPTYLPAGFRFQSASQAMAVGEPLIGLQYGNGTSVVSVYENLMRHPQPDRIMRPRLDVLIVRQNGVRLFIIGNLADAELQRIAQSLK